MDSTRYLTRSLLLWALFLAWPAWVTGMLLEPSAEDFESSSSKRIVELFKSPLSISVLTEQEIRMSGITSVPELLKMVPGVIVRESTNGRHEVYIRGTNIPYAFDVSSMRGGDILVMVDGRSVFEYSLGGVFWDAVPVDVSDIQKIEVVRGAVSSLYGPNAVSGVIHIITKRRHEPDETEASVAIKRGTHASQLNHVTVDQSFGEHHLRVSGFDDHRNRYDEHYYNYAAQDFQNLETFTANEQASMPSPKTAGKKRSATVSINNHPLSPLAYDVSYSYLESEGHRLFASRLEQPYTWGENQDEALNVKLNYFNWFGRFSYNEGNSRSQGVEQFGFEYQNIQHSLEYQLRMPRLLLRPGLFFHRVAYRGEFLAGRQELRNSSVRLRAEYDFNNDVRLVGAVSYDHYNVPSDAYFGYQLAYTHALSALTNMRFGVQRANNSSFFNNGFVNLDIDLVGTPNVRLQFLGDPESGLTRTSTLEWGLRHRVDVANELDIEVFYTHKNHMHEYLRGAPFPDGSDMVIPNRYEETPTELTQVGSTLTWLYQATTWELESFLTWQQARVEDTFISNQKPLQTFNGIDQSSPAIFGGFNWRWEPLPKWQLFSNFIYTSAYQIYSDTIGLESSTPAHALMSFNVTHLLTPVVSASFGIHNLATKQVSQVYFTDPVEPSLYIGLNATF